MLCTKAGFIPQPDSFKAKGHYHFATSVVWYPSIWYISLYLSLAFSALAFPSLWMANVDGFFSNPLEV